MKRPNKNLWTCQYEAMRKWEKLCQKQYNLFEQSCWVDIANPKLSLEELQPEYDKLDERMRFYLDVMARLKSWWMYNGVPEDMFPWPKSAYKFHEAIQEGFYKTKGGIYPKGSP